MEQDNYLGIVDIIIGRPIFNVRMADIIIMIKEMIEKCAFNQYEEI